MKNQINQVGLSWWVIEWVESKEGGYMGIQGGCESLTDLSLAKNNFSAIPPTTPNTTPLASVPSFSPPVEATVRTPNVEKTRVKKW